MPSQQYSAALGGRIKTEIHRTPPLTTKSVANPPLSTGSAAKDAQTRASSAEYIVSEIKRHKTVMAVAALVVVAAAAIIYFSFIRKPVMLTDKDTILLADFTNTTGDPVFDDTLKQALAVQLGQSPFLNIFSEDRVRDALKFMNRPPDERVTRDVAREICERQGIKAMLLGSISGLGSHYVISLDAVNANTGDSIATEQIETDGKEQG